MAVRDFESKSQAKRAMTAVQDLGERLVALNSERLNSLDLPERLIDAVELAQRVTAHEGRRRQMQYIGKLMRDVELEPLERQFALWDAGESVAKAAFRNAERWRDRLMSEGNAVNDFEAEYPSAPMFEIRSAVAEAHHERAMRRAPKSERELFRLVRGVLGAPVAVEAAA